MKTTKILMMGVAVATMVAFAACGEKDNEEETPQNNTAPERVEASANTIVVGTEVSQIYGQFQIESSGRGYLAAQSLAIGSGKYYFIRGDAVTYNTTCDLSGYTAGADYAFAVNCSDTTISFQQDNHVDGYPHFYGVIGGREYSEGAFESGTLTISKSDELFTYKLSGVLRTGLWVSFHVSIPASEWTHLEW